MSIPFIGMRYTPEAFDTYVKSLNLRSSSVWQGKYPVLHHTAMPSLAMRPSGLTSQHLKNLLDYYQNQLGWNGAPHLFIDDLEDGIIVFQRLDRRGVHARSFNSEGWGIEMLGDFDTEDPGTGRGYKVVQNAAHALKTLLSVNGGTTSDIKFHRDDPKTNKTCPGKLITKSMISSAVNASGSLHLNAGKAEPEEQEPSPWAINSWNWIESQGFMSGNPRGVLTREMLATVLYRYHEEFGVGQ